MTALIYLGAAALGALVVLWIAFRIAEASAAKRWPARGEFVEVDGVRLHYLRKGSGQPVILLHGNAGLVEDYVLSGVVDAVAERWQAVVFERPGHGHSGRPRDPAIASPMAQAKLIRAAAQKLGLEQPVLVGHSWSGGVILCWALQFPDEVRGLVSLQGTVYPEPSLDDPIYPMLCAPIVGPLLAGFSLPIGRAKVARVFQKAFAPDPVPPLYLDAARSMFTRASQARAIAADALERTKVLEEIHPRYAEIETPTVIVASHDDGLVPVERHGLRLAKVLARAEVHDLYGAGHQVPQSHPEVVVPAVERVLAMGSA